MCSPQDGAECQECYLGFHLMASTNSCEVCELAIEGCIYCEETPTGLLCTKCEQGYYLEATTDPLTNIYNFT